MQDNNAQPIFRGKISSFESDTDEHGCLTKARVIPDTTPDVVTRPFYINWTIRGKTGDLQVNTPVVCARFEDGEGLILARADGEHTSKFPGDVTIYDGDLKVESGDVQADGISLKEHIHQGVHGPTSPPQ